jgi:hypothetical protein
MVLQLRVVLRGISPLIWRRLLVRSDATVADLHATLQLALGWTDEHLNRFVIHGREYGVAHIGGMSFGDDPREECGGRFRLPAPRALPLRIRLHRRMVKRQQMRWTPRGAHLLLQVRTRVLDDELTAAFRRWYPSFDHMADSRELAA